MITSLAAVAFVLVLVCYGVSTVFYARIFFGEETDRDCSVAGYSRTAGIACQVLFLVALGIKYGELPFVGIANVLSFVALSLVLVHSIVEARAKVRGTGAFVVGLALILHLMSWSSMTEQPAVLEFLRSPVFGAHVLLAIIGYTGFTLSALYGVMYLLQFRSLKSRQFGAFFKNLPALDFLGKMNLEGMVFGLISLSASIVLGLLLAMQLDKRIFTDAKFIQVLVAWLIYVVVVTGHFAAGWSGRKLVYLSLASFALLIVAILIVTTFFNTFHNFT